MPLIDEVKQVLRVTSDAFNTEITSLIEAAKRDLAITAIDVSVVTETDAQVKMAILLYCKANFGYNNPDAERFMASYETIKRTLALSYEYALE